MLARDATGWRVQLGHVPKKLDAFEWKNSHPVYGSHRQTYRFPPVATDAVRIEVTESNPGRDWTIGEVEVYGPAETGAAVPEAATGGAP